jgi:acid phosphatase type 7
MDHFITFDAETDFPNAPDLPGGSGDEDASPFAATSAQLAWLKKDLASVGPQENTLGHCGWPPSLVCQPVYMPHLPGRYGADLVPVWSQALL